MRLSQMNRTLRIEFDDFAVTAVTLARRWRRYPRTHVTTQGLLVLDLMSSERCELFLSWVPSERDM